jgi:hypothetical protein
MSQLRKLQRNVERQEGEEEEGIEVPPNHRELPTGKLLSPPVRGDFLALPLFGWVALRAGDRVPLVMLTLLLIRSLEDPMPRGTLEVTLPVLGKTEMATLAALERFGWDGRVWPTDEGWPSGDSVEEDNIRELMRQAKLRATLTFPPNASGASAQTVTVSRAQGPFLMPPLPAPDGEPDPVKLAKLMTLCADPSTMLLSKSNS